MHEVGIASSILECVAAELQKRNPGFEGKVRSKIEGGAVTELHFITENVTDISPVRALAETTAQLMPASRASSR